MNFAGLSLACSTAPRSTRRPSVSYTLGCGTWVSFATPYPVMGSCPMRPRYVRASYWEKPSSLRAVTTLGLTLGYAAPSSLDRSRLDDWAIVTSPTPDSDVSQRWSSPLTHNVVPHIKGSVRRSTRSIGLPQ